MESLCKAFSRMPQLVLSICGVREETGEVSTLPAGTWLKAEVHVRWKLENPAPVWVETWAQQQHPNPLPSPLFGMEVHEHMVPSFLRLHRRRDPKVWAGQGWVWFFLVRYWLSFGLVWFGLIWSNVKRWRAATSAEVSSSRVTIASSVMPASVETVSTSKRWQFNSKYYKNKQNQTYLSQVGNRHKVVCKPCDDGWLWYAQNCWLWLLIVDCDSHKIGLLQHELLQPTQCTCDPGKRKSASDPIQIVYCHRPARKH